MDDSFFVAIQKKLDEYCQLEDGHLMWKGPITVSGGLGLIAVQGKQRYARQYAYMLNHKSDQVPQDAKIIPFCEQKMCLTHLIMLKHEMHDAEKNDCFAKISE